MVVQYQTVSPGKILTYNIIWTEQLISKIICVYTNAYIHVITTDDQIGYAFEGEQEGYVGEFEEREKREKYGN